MEKRTINDQIKFWKSHYSYVKNIVDRIDSGENIKADSIAASEVGQRQHCVDEANIAVERLAELNCFHLPKIE